MLLLPSYVLEAGILGSCCFHFLSGSSCVREISCILQKMIIGTYNFVFQVL